MYDNVSGHRWEVDVRRGQHHKCEWSYVGHITFSTDASTVGKHEWECPDPECGSKMYSQRIAPAGGIEVKKGTRRFSGEQTKPVELRRRDGI